MVVVCDIIRASDGGTDEVELRIVITGKRAYTAPSQMIDAQML